MTYKVLYSFLAFVLLISLAGCGSNGTVAPPPVPSAPAAPVATPGHTQVTVTWAAVANATSYEVWYHTADNSAAASQFAGDSDASDTTAVITGLTNETTYYVWVKAKNQHGTSGFSPSVSVKPHAPPPSAPAVSTVVAGDTQLTLSWTAVTHATSYEIWYHTADNSAAATQFTGDTNASDTTAVLNGLTNETTYYVWTKAKNAYGTSAFSPSATGKPHVPAPAPPTAPTVTSEYRQATVTWAAVTNASNYEVWYSQTNDSATATQFTDDTNTADTTAVVTGLINGGTYYIWVKAKNAYGTSGFSLPGIATPHEPAPSAPAAPSLTPGDGYLTVNWVRPEFAPEFEIWFNTANDTATATQFMGDGWSRDTTATITGLVNETTYYVWVKAKNPAGTSDFSPSSTAAPHAGSWSSVGAAAMQTGKVAEVTKLQVMNSQLYIGYSDSTDGYKVSVLHNDGTWQALGGAPVSSDSVAYPSLAVSSWDEVAVAYENTAVGHCCKAKAMKYTATEGWSVLANADFSERQILNNSLSFSNNQLLLAFLDRTTAGDFASVMWTDRTQPTTWSYYGDSLFSTPDQIYTITLNGTNCPWVAYTTASGDVVVKFHASCQGVGTGWPDVGNGLRQRVYSEFAALGVDSLNFLYVAYNDNTQGGKMVVRKFISGEFSTVPNTASFVSDVHAKYGDMFVDGDRPYIAYFDDTADKIFVKTFVGGEWKTMDTNGISTGGDISYLSIAVERGKPYIAYKNVSDSSLSVKVYQ